VVILELIHAQGPERGGWGFTALSLHAQRDVFIRLNNQHFNNHLVIHSNSFGSHSCPPCGDGDDSFKFLPYQLSMVG
jgi:hypothetical protein